MSIINDYKKQFKPEELRGKTVMIANGKIATVLEYFNARSTKYCYVGKDADGLEIKWTSTGHGMHAGTAIAIIDPQAVITGPGMYEDKNGEAVYVRKLVASNGKWIGTFEDGDVEYFTEYGAPHRTWLVKKLDLIDKTGGIFFTSHYLVYIEPGTQRRHSKTSGLEYRGKLVSDYRYDYYWDADGKFSRSSNPHPSISIEKFDIVDKFIPTPRKQKMKPGAPIKVHGEYTSRNGSAIVLEGRVTDGNWYGYVKGDKTNHHIWDAFGRVYTLEGEKWIINGTKNDLDIQTKPLLKTAADDHDDPPEDIPTKPKKLKFEVGKRFVTTGETVSIILSLDKKQNTMLVYNYTSRTTMELDSSGRSDVANLLDLVRDYVEPLSGTLWVNVIEDLECDNFKGETGTFSRAYYSRKDADNEAAALEGAKRFARVKVEWVEGQFDGD